MESYSQCPLWHAAGGGGAHGGISRLQAAALNVLHSPASTSVSARSTAAEPRTFTGRVHASKQLAPTATTVQSASFSHAVLADATAKTLQAAARAGALPGSGSA